MFLIFAIPGGITYAFGRMAKDQRQGWALFGAMAFLFFAGVTAAYWAEAAGNPVVHGMGGNNGSAFAGISANTPWYNVTLGIVMLAGRFFMTVPALAIAGVLSGKKSVAPGAGTMPTTGPLFVTLLVGVIVIVGALTFFPVLALGPIVEHFVALSGKVY